MDPSLPAELLESTHTFPGVYKIKAIGANSDDFAGRLLGVVRLELGGDEGLVHSVRSTSGGRHVAVTLDVPVQNAEQVRALYERVRGLDGLLFLL